MQRIFDGLVNVRVVTVVGRVADPPEPSGRAQVRGDAIVTIFNLIDGDVTNVIAPALKDDVALRDFHAAQVEKSLTVLPANLEALVSLGKTILGELRP